MQDTKGLLDTIRHHDQVPIMVNENCAIPLPETVLPTLLQPHKLGYYYFMFMDQGAETCQVDFEDRTVADSQVVFGLPNQIFAHAALNKNNQQYKISFDENTLALLPQAYPFLVDPSNSNLICFDPAAKQRVKAVLANLFQLLHSPGKQQHAAIILAYLNALLTEFNTAYFANSQQEATANPRQSKYIAFKLAVEAHLTEQHDVHTIADELAMTPGSLYSLVKEFSGLSPKEWITNRLMQEAQRKLQYTPLSIKELAYELGFNDPAYFSRLFKKRTGKNVSTFLAERHDLSKQ